MLPHVKEIVGIDISPGATERFNSHMKALNAGEGSYGVVADIVTDKNVLSGRKFDLVYVCSFTFKVVALTTYSHRLYPFAVRFSLPSL